MLAQRLRLLRLLRRWSQEDLAAASGLHRTYISLLERAACNVTLDNLEKLARAFGVSVCELFENETADRSSRRRPAATKQSVAGRSTVRASASGTKGRVLRQERDGYGSGEGKEP